MRKSDLISMQFDELWQIHEELVKILLDRIVAEKRDLEKRLAQLNRVEIIRDPGNANPISVVADHAPRRKYPKVLPKYYNPLTPSETWSGRGKQPRWLVAALKTGHKLDEFKIGNAEKSDRRKKGRPRPTQLTLRTQPPLCEPSSPRVSRAACRIASRDRQMPAAWQLQDADVSCPGTSFGRPDRSELPEFPSVKHRKA